MRREKYIPNGGPDGGDGGRGGHVILRGNRNYWTLLHLKYDRHILAGHGESGSKNRSFGKDGADKVIEVPCGTVVYNAETGETKEVYGTEYGELFEPANVGVFGKSVYFAAVDHAAKSAAVMRFSVETGELSELCALEYRAEYTCTSLSADGSTLLLSFGNAGKAKLLKLDLEGGNKAETALEAGADFVYGCAYDSAEGGLAVYYRDTDGREHIGTVNAKNGRIKNIYTFGENVYAYRDTLELHGGFLYWVTQINATGSVADHYKFVVYDCKKDTAKEYLKTFSF